jgi:predicted RNA-binding Zn ribbon-like protein
MMAGERAARGPAPSVQPGGRDPAPGELAVVQAFINTHYDLEVDHGAEILGTPEALAAWLAARGLAATPVDAGATDLRRALAAREALRALARSNGAGPAGAGPVVDRDSVRRLDRAARGAPVEIGFGTGGPYFISGGAGVSGALGVLMAITARAMIDGSWTRLKVCPGDHCGWAFYDHSRNQAGRWCSMSVCGGRAKARAHYRRRRPGAD